MRRVQVAAVTLAVVLATVVGGSAIAGAVTGQPTIDAGAPIAAQSDGPANETTTSDGATASTTDDGANETATNASGAAEVAPGERMAGVLGVSEAELSGEIASRSFGSSVAAARTNRTKAAAVGEQIDDVRDRLASMRERRQRLDAARENGTISEGRYRAEMATLTAEIRASERLLNDTEAVARGLPHEALEERGVNASAIDALRRNASRLGGPEVAAIARGIAGRDAGRAIGRRAGNRTRGPGERSGPGERPAERGPQSTRGAGDASNASAGPGKAAGDARNRTAGDARNRTATGTDVASGSGNGADGAGDGSAGRGSGDTGADDAGGADSDGADDGGPGAGGADSGGAADGSGSNGADGSGPNGPDDSGSNGAPGAPE